MMTHKEGVVEGTAENEDLNLDEETGTEVTPNAGTEETDETKAPTKKKKNPYDDLKERLGAKLDEKDARIAQLEKKDAIREFGEDVVNSEEVKEIMSKYPGMGYAEASKLANIEPKPSAGAYGLPGTPVTAINDDTKTVTWKDLDNLQETDKVKYKVVLDKITKGEMAVV